MNALRIGLPALVASALCFAAPPASAEVRTLYPVQTLTKPAGPSSQYFGNGIAIDGPFIIVLAVTQGTSSNQYSALLYRRSSSDGKWVFRKTLVSATGAFARTDVKMKGGLAAVQFGGNVSLFEYATGDYVPANTVAPIVHPGGLAISAGRLLVGGNGCDDDALLYEKNANGLWDVSGRLDDNAGECAPEGLTVQLNYNTAIVRDSDEAFATVWRRNGSALDWVFDGTLTQPAGVGLSSEPFGLQGTTAVANSGYAYVRTGAGAWARQGRATPVDNDNSYGITFNTVFRDGVLVTSESGRGWPFPRVYVEATPGHFEHVISLFTTKIATGVDVSGRTVVATVSDAQGTTTDVEVFTLPAQLRAPDHIVDDFEDRDTSDFDVRSGQFQLATRGTDDVFAQSSTTGFAVALASQSDWSDYQRIEADIAPTYTSSDSWAGLVARYVDTNNYYFASIRANGAFAVYKRVNSVNTLLQSGIAPVGNPLHATLTVDGNRISLGIDRDTYFITRDDSLTHGRAGIATWKARADFDDVHVAGTTPYTLFFRDWGPYTADLGIDMKTLGGNWGINQDNEGFSSGLQQLDKSGDARAYVGVPVANQDIVAQVKLGSFGTASTGAWFGVVARFVDPQNTYYVSVRSTNQIQIRKIVNGVITVLASANFTAVPGEVHDLRFRLINDQLDLYVDTQLVASAHDSAIASGQYGLATYRTAATFNNLYVGQP